MYYYPGAKDSTFGPLASQIASVKEPGFNAQDYWRQQPAQTQGQTLDPQLLRRKRIQEMLEQILGTGSANP